MKSRNIEPGFIYVVYSKPINLFKIGCSKDILSRIWGFDNQIYPQPLLPILLFPSSDKYGTEKKLHDLLSKKRIGRKELFDLNNDDILLIITFISKEINVIPNFSMMDSFLWPEDNKDSTRFSNIMNMKASMMRNRSKNSEPYIQIMSLMRTLIWQFGNIISKEDEKEIEKYKKILQIALGDES